MKCKENCNAGWACWFGMGLWSLAVVAFVLGWVSLIIQKLVLSLDPVAWYWNALVLGVLAMPWACKGDSSACEAPASKK